MVHLDPCHKVGSRPQLFPLSRSPMLKSSFLYIHNIFSVPCPFRDTCTQAHIVGCSPSPSVAPSVFTLVTPGACVASIARAAPIPSDAAVAFPVHTVTLCKGSPDKPSALQLPGSARGSRNTLASCPGTWHPDFPLIIH